jgi:hypothetical protein
VPISQHPLGNVLLKMNVSQAANGANWMEWQPGSAPKQVNLGLSPSDLLRMSSEAYRLLQGKSGPMNFTAPSRAVTPDYSAIAKVGALAAQYLGEKYSNLPGARNGFEYQADGTLEPAGKHEASTEDIKDGIEVVKRIGIFKKLNGHHRQLYCAFMAEPVWWKPEPVWPGSQMSRLDDGWVKRIFPDPSARFDIQVCRMQYSDYLIMALRSYECKWR